MYVDGRSWLTEAHMLGFAESAFELNSLKGDYIGGNIGDYYRGY